MLDLKILQEAYNQDTKVTVYTKYNDYSGYILRYDLVNVDLDSGGYNLIIPQELIRDVIPYVA